MNAENEQKKSTPNAQKKTKRKGSSAVKKSPQVSSEQLPRKNIEQALRIPRALREVHAGGPVGWRELAKAAGLGLSQANKYYLWAAQAYNLVDKDGDNFSLSETGRKILAPTRPGEDGEALRKAVLSPVTLSRFFTDYDGNPFPADEHLGNILEVRYQIPRERVEEAKILLKENGMYSGILEPTAQGAYMVRLDPSTPGMGAAPSIISPREPGSPPLEEPPLSDFSKMCFIITPIGEDESEERKHANMVLHSVIEPIAEELGYKPVRADQIDRSGIITKQIFECLVKARLCIADLSFNNPNAFYELGIRHACKLPTVQVIRKGDRIPFDVSQGRTIKIDMTDVYEVIQSVESAKNELRQHLKHILSGEYNGDDNPVNVYLPTLLVQLLPN